MIVLFSKEFELITQDIAMNTEFMKLNDFRHHGISRLDHSYRVAYYSYKIMKFLRLNYVEGTRAALLHDFFTDDVENLGSFNRLIKHPICALENAKNHFDISPLQEDIIVKHMFPVTIRPPKYLETVVVDLVDDVASIYERVSGVTHEVSYTTMVLVSMITNFIRFL